MYPVITSTCYQNAHSVQAQRGSFGQTISRVELVNEETGLRLTFTDGGQITFRDEGRCRGGDRWLTVDGDDLSQFTGAEYRGAVLKDAASYRPGHEVQFLEVLTTRGSITVSAHNSTTGYYEGIDLVVY